MNVDFELSCVSAGRESNAQLMMPMDLDFTFLYDYCVCGVYSTFFLEGGLSIQLTSHPCSCIGRQVELVRPDGTSQ
jgi:hypothetical protein